MGKFNLHESLGFSLINTAFQIKQNLTSTFQKRGFDTTVDQFAVLASLIGQDGITQTKISEKSCKNTSNLTRILIGMEDKGLIVREIGADARSRNVFLTDKGRQIYKDLELIVIEYQTQVFNNLSEEEKALFSIMIKKIQI